MKYKYKVQGVYRTVCANKLRERIVLVGALKG